MITALPTQPNAACMAYMLYRQAEAAADEGDAALFSRLISLADNWDRRAKLEEAREWGTKELKLS
jgi:hypothetical protein